MGLYASGCERFEALSEYQLNTYCTLFDSNYLDKGIVLHESLCKTASDFTLFILPMDDLCERILTDLKLRNTIVLERQHFEMHQDLSGIKNTRSRAEYCWTCTPCLIKYVLDAYGCPVCTYIDADMCFYSNPSSSVQAMFDAGATAQIVEHGFPKSIECWGLEKAAGRFCVEFNTFANDESSHAILNHWKAQCCASCTASGGSDVLGDQGYLDEWPTLYECVHICSDFAVGVAPWNARRFRVLRKGAAVLVQEKLSRDTHNLVFFHFHNLEYINRCTVNINAYSRFAGCDDSFRDVLYIPYLIELEKAKTMLESRYGIEVMLSAHPAAVRANSGAKTHIIRKVKTLIMSRDAPGVLARFVSKKMRHYMFKGKDIVAIPELHESCCSSELR